MNFLMSKREPFLLLQDIIESIEKIKSYTHGMTYDIFYNDDKTIDAVIRNFEIIGEAANRIPVPYNHMTLPTNLRVKCSVVAVSAKQQNRNNH